MRILAAAGILLMCLAGGDAELSKEDIDIAKETKKTEVAQAKTKILDLEKRRATAAKSGNNMAVLLLANDIQLAKKRLAFVSKKTVTEYAREISEAKAAAEMIEQRNEQRKAEDLAAHKKEVAEIAKKQAVADRKAEEVMKNGVTAKEIETFGKELTGKRIQMSAKFHQVSDTWVKFSLKDESYVGFMVWDNNGDLFQYAIANKEKYGLILLELKKRQNIGLSGIVEIVDRTTFLFVDDIQR